MTECGGQVTPFYMIRVALPKDAGATLFRICGLSIPILFVRQCLCRCRRGYWMEAKNTLQRHNRYCAEKRARKKKVGEVTKVEEVEVHLKADYVLRNSNKRHHW